MGIFTADPKDGVILNQYDVSAKFIEVYKEKDENTVEAFVTKAGQNTNVIELLDEFFGQIVLSGVDMLEVDPYTAMVDLTNYGYWMLGMLATILIAVGAAAAVEVGTGVGAIASAFVTKVGFFSTMLASFTALIFQVILVALFICAIVHAYILPIIPYFYHLFAVFGMLILVAEFMLGAVIHALHVRMTVMSLFHSNRNRATFSCLTWF